MAARIAWVLNLDADLELGAASYAPKRSVQGAMRPHAERLAKSLLAPDDLWIDEDAIPLSRSNGARGLAGRAFCPTPRAIDLLVRAGAEPEPHPPVEVLRRVNSRAFCAALGPTLPDATFVVDLEVARAILERAPAIGDGWRVKRAFGVSGRGQRIVEHGPITDADRRFLGSWIADGGVQIEPNVAIEREYAIHGMIDEDGSLRLGRVVEQRCDAQGAWIATERCTKAPSLEDEATRVAAALARASYFGPFGIDAFTYRAHGSLALQPRSEINARYTMGFAVGLAR